MDVRAANPQDASSIREVAQESWFAAYEHFLTESTIKQAINKWYTIDTLKKAIARTDRSMYVSVAGEVVGFVLGGPSEDGPGDGVLGRIYVRPDYWGDGHGTALLEQLFKDLRAEDIDSVWVPVLAPNQVGRSFYDDHGFEVHEERTIELVDQHVKEIVMVRSL